MLYNKIQFYLEIVSYQIMKNMNIKLQELLMILVMRLHLLLIIIMGRLIVIIKNCKKLHLSC